MNKILSVLTFWAPKAPVLAHNKGGRLLTSFYNLLNLGTFLLLCGGVLPTSMAQDLTIETPANIRTPHNTGDGALLTLRANNIQVRAEWSAEPADLFDVDDDGKLYFIGNIDTATNIAVNVTVKDKFSELNNAYDDLMAHATINMSLMPGVPRTFFVLGGYGGSAVHLNNVWKSSDGQNWTMASNLWAGLSSHQAVVHNGTIYVLGGDRGYRTNDVWSSTDGDTWDRLGAAAWSPRINHQAVVHDDKIYVLGGDDNNSFKNDVWSSTDGISWSAITLSANWPKRRLHQAVSYRGRLYVLGGNFGGFTLLNDVWSSADGSIWSRETDASNGAEWTARFGHQAVVHQGRIYVLGGTDGTIRNDVWSSVGGKTWSRVTSGADWPPRFVHQVVSSDTRLYVLGGDGVTEDNLNDVWSSVDGNEWSLETGTSGAGWPGRRYFQAFVFP